MATIDELFDTMPAEASITYEELVIDAEGRKIYVPDAEKLFGVESDTQAERKYFRCPRYVGNGLDLAGCFLRVNFRNANGDVDAYLVKDVTIDGEDITFSWELSKKVTAYKGEVQFVVCAIMGAGLPEWNTTLAVGTVLEGLEPDSSTVEAETSDVIAQLLAMVEAQTAAVEAVGAAQRAEVKKVGENTTEEAKNVVEAKGEAVKASIPEDYSTLSATVDKLARDRAAAIVCAAEGETIQVNDASADPIVGLRLFGKSVQDGTPTPDAPVEIVSAKAPTVTVCGKNLLKITAESRTLNGVTFTVHENGTVYVKGTATADTFFELSLLPAGVLPGVKYLLSGCAGGASAKTYYLRVSDRLTQAFDDYGDGQMFSYADVSGFQVTIRVINGATVSGVLFTPMIRPAVIEDSTYESYKDAQTLTLSTPNSLPGIPVSSGGNYTDANGQQWIADEIDLERGVYVQRVREVIFTGVEKLANNWFPIAVYDIPSKELYMNANTLVRCSHFSHVYCGNLAGTTIAFGSLSGFGYTSVDDLTAFFSERYAAGDPVKVQYALVAPIETPLSTEEIEAYKALLANKPTTTVLNDASAWMALEYAADPKTYIDNKIAALLAADK